MFILLLRSRQLHARVYFYMAGETLYLSCQNRSKLEKLQGRLVKCRMGLGPHYMTTPLIQALEVQSIAEVVDVKTSVLFKNIIATNSIARRFNLKMPKNNVKCKELTNQQSKGYL